MTRKQFAGVLHLAKLKSQRLTLIEYLHVKAEQEDWHGVRDAAVDIEILEVKISWFTPEGKGRAHS